MSKPKKKETEKSALKPTSRQIQFQLDLQRKQGTRDIGKRILIVCEDEKSSPNYFESLKKHFKLSAASVQVVGSGGYSQPQQVVDKAKTLKEAADSEESSTEPFDEVWCAIDGDYGEKITNARHSTDAHGIKLAISTPCFEHWILLHFIESDQPDEKCDSAESRLKSNGIPNYNKGKTNFDSIMPNVYTATERARKQRKHGIQNTLQYPENQNPCSEVYLLIDSLGICQDEKIRTATSPKKKKKP